MHFMNVLRMLSCCAIQVALARAQGIDFNPAELPWAIVDEPYYPRPFAFRGEARCPAGDASFTAQGELPEGLAITGTGQIGGVPQRTGTYRFAVRVADSCGVTVKPMILVVTGAPILVVSTKLIEFHYRRGGPPPEPQSMLVTGSWPNMAYRVDGQGTAWVRAAPRTGRIPRPGAAVVGDVVEVHVVPEGLASGAHEMQLVVSTGLAVNAPTVSVRLVVE
jgi:hypothetical protein